MAIIRFEVPEDSELWPCPQACGGFSEDPYGGPCEACWAKVHPSHSIDADAFRRESLGEWPPDSGGED